MQGLDEGSPEFNLGLLCNSVALGNTHMIRRFLELKTGDQVTPLLKFNVGFSEKLEVLDNADACYFYDHVNLDVCKQNLRLLMEARTPDGRLRLGEGWNDRDPVRSRSLIVEEESQ